MKDLLPALIFLAIVVVMFSGNWTSPISPPGSSNDSGGVFYSNPMFVPEKAKVLIVPQGALVYNTSEGGTYIRPYYQEENDWDVLRLLR